MIQNVLNYVNLREPSRYFVMFHKTYMAHCPQTLYHDVFYLTHHILMATINQLCKKPLKQITHYELLGYSSKVWMNSHIMLRTAHRSTNGVHTHKQVTEDQQVLSSVLN